MPCEKLVIEASVDKIYVAIDVEATGMEAGVDEIIEVAAVKFRGDEVLETFTSLVRPRHSLPLKITRLTSISPETLADAPRFSAVAPQLVGFIRSYPLVGHSIEFDLAMLRAQGLNVPQPCYDTFTLATLLLPQAPTYSLIALADRLGIAHPEDHRALNDADVARQVFVELLDQLGRLDLAALDEIVQLATRAGSPLRELFREVQLQRARVALSEAAAQRGDSGGAARGRQLAPQPLRPTGDVTPIEPGVVEGFFSPAGALGRAFPGYEARESQVAMSLAVTESLNEGHTLLVEAPTGTGKSLAYLVPAAIFAAQRGERVVVSTNTINLQDQLYFKDIPDLQRILSEDAGPGAAEGEPPFSAAILKGRGNYLCLRRYKQLRREERLAPEEAMLLLKIGLWLPTTESGDKAELLLVDRENRAWEKVNVTQETCIGPRCADFHNCWFFGARKKAEAAHVLVVNHALLLADLAANAQVLPAYDHLIIDEAHHLEDVATDQLSFSVTQYELGHFLDEVYSSGGARQVDGLLATLPNHFRGSSAPRGAQDAVEQLRLKAIPAAESARNALGELFSQLRAFIAKSASNSHYESRLRLTAAVRRNPLWGEIGLAWEQLALPLLTIGDALGRLESILLELGDAGLAEYDELLLRVQSYRRYLTETRVQIGHVLLGGEDGIYWLSHDRGRDTLAINAAPLHVGETLQALLFSQKRAAVLASATLTVNGSFDFMRERLGLEEAVELGLESPFAYERQALLYLPTDMPEPSQRGYQEALARALTMLCTASGGRTLALFTSYAALRQVYELIQETLEEQEIVVLAQGIDGSRRNLLQRFKEFPRTVLLGTSSFWEGVDVVGDALSVLAITKLPFAVPDDPIFAARSEQFADAFNEYSVPLTILKFKQGFGRLIRSKDDRGVVAVFDKRLISKGYGKTFLGSLPPAKVQRGTLAELPLAAARWLV
jgi:predicted DnaQ family exonuclease/DinG family helicase